MAGVLLFDRAALHDFCAESFKEAGHDAGPAGAGVFLGRGFGAACDTNAFVPAIAAHGRVESGSDHAHSGYAQEALVDTAEERLHLFGLVVAERWVDGDEIAVLRFETKILVLEIAQALAEQSSGGEQNERHRGLRDNQRFLRDGAAAAHGTVAAAQSFDRIDMRSHPGGSDTENYSGEHRDRERKEQNGPGGRRIDRDVVRRAAAVVEREIENQCAARVRDSDSENAADDGEQGGLDERFAHQPAARRTESDAQRRLRALLQAAGEHEIGKIAAGDKQHTAGCDEQQLQSGLILIAHGCDTGAAGNEMQGLLTPGLLFAGLHVGHMAREPVMELDAQLGFERLGIHAGAHAADDVEPVRVGAFEALGFAIEQRFGVDRDPDIGHAPAGELGAVEAGRSDADHGKEVAVDLITRTHNGGIGAVFIAPDVIAHDGDGRCAGLIVGIGHQAADPGVDAEGAEEIAGDVFAIARIDGALRSCAADTEWRIAGLQCGKVGELGRVFAEILVGFVGEERKIPIAVLCVPAPVAAADFVAHAPEFFGLGDRQRLEHHLMYEGEDRGRGANTQGERDHRGGGESGCFSELPKRFLQIRHFVSLDCVWCRTSRPRSGLV